MKPKTFHLITYGCQMNKSDSERIVFVLEKMGLREVSREKAGFIILNLCSVRQSAIDRVWGFLLNNKKQITNNKAKKQLIILTGCILEEDKKKFRDRVDLILDINDLPRWPKIIIKTLKHKNIKTTARRGVSPRDNEYFSITPHYQSKFSAYVPIMTGCNNYCAYCVVPYTRGREKSRPVEEILQEVKGLVKKGYKEITLLGQNVNSYQSKISNSQFLISKQISNFKFPISKNQINFPILLKLIDSVPGDYWLSFITSYPKDMSEELIKCFSECQHLMPYLHLPVQSGSDKILKKMNRQYTISRYKNLIRKIRKQFTNNSQDISVSTDIIVGFPGETESDFQKTIKLMKWVKFDMAYIAEYSPRPGTTAAKSKDDVPKEEKKRRREILTEILKKTALENNKKMVGKVVDVLIEADLCEYLRGKTRTFKHIKINVAPTFGSDKDFVGNFVKVKITKANVWGLEGEIVS